MRTDPISYEYADGVLNNHKIMVTGASDGIGRALAVHIAGLGAQVVLHGRNTKKLEAVYDQITNLGGAPRPSIAVLDLATADSLSKPWKTWASNGASRSRSATPATAGRCCPTICPNRWKSTAICCDGPCCPATNSTRAGRWRCKNCGLSKTTRVIR